MSRPSTVRKGREAAVEGCKEKSAPCRLLVVQNRDMVSLSPMSRLRRNEWNFASNAANAISSLLKGPEFKDSPLGHAEAELTELRGARRLDLVIFRRDNPVEPLITGELKVPWDARGRTPYNSAVVEDGHRKASNAGALYFLTWNIKRVVVWKTDDPGVPLPDRVVHDQEIVPETLRTVEDLERSDVRESLRTGVESLVKYLTGLVAGPPAPVFLPLDRIFIARLEAALDYPILKTAEAIEQKLSQGARFRREHERWMREVQGWTVSAKTEGENVDRSARFSCYVLVNRLCFYNALRRKYDRLPRLSISKTTKTGEQLRRRLDSAFAAAKRYTGDYETVFDGDYGDSLPFLADEAIPEWRNLVSTLDQYDFAHIDVDVIGSMYEQLITPEERHRYGQHYTQPFVVDLINAFAIVTGDSRVLDPACGGGTFLVRAYARKAFLDSSLEHAELLECLYGCDILNYACHLTTINLAIRDLIDDDNYPRVHLGDFLRFAPNAVFSLHPIRIHAGGLRTDTREVRVEAQSFDAIVGNPPYISSRGMNQTDKEFYYDEARRSWPRYPWSKSADIYTYFWLHAERFLKPSGRLSLLTQAAWLDVEYGIPIQKWMLDNFRICGILETEAEPWFSDARVATVVSLLVRDDNSESRERNLVKFVQFKKRLSEIVGGSTSEEERQALIAGLGDRIGRTVDDTEQAEYRIRVVRQQELEQRGLGPSGSYEGSKWGRYLRSTETLYVIQERNAEAFAPLERLAPIKRGLTTNCDDFFIVEDISETVLVDWPTPRGFKETCGVDRSQVESGEIKVVRRSDGVKFALGSQHLRPILRSARDLDSFTTNGIGTRDFAVFISENRHDLSPLARKYILAGEREGWHETASFAAARSNDADWYTLREAEAAPILFVKTMQYSPFVLLNEAMLLPNQRLYNLSPIEGVDPVALCAILNSTVFACERYAAVKALGREAAFDVEVFSASAYKTPDIRRFAEADVGALASCMRQLCMRRVGSMLEESLTELGFSAAQAYAEAHPIRRDIWPDELKHSERQEVDAIVLRNLGLASRDISQVRDRIYDELVAYTRKLRLLELEAQRNRLGGIGSAGPTARALADDIWSQLREGESIELRRIPDDFLPARIQTKVMQIPAPGKVALEHPSLFGSRNQLKGKIGNTAIEFENREEALYVSLLAENSIVGDVRVPARSASCATVREAMQTYLEHMRAIIWAEVTEITTDEHLRNRIFREAWKHVTGRTG
jgi:hypothetical protein